MAIADDFTHFDDHGGARMVDVSGKPDTHRTAAAAGRVLVNRETWELIRTGGVKKGDVLCVARVAGIMAAKPAAHGVLDAAHMSRAGRGMYTIGG